MSSYRKGFTLVELIVVIGVIAILGTLGILGFGEYQKDGRDTMRESRAVALSEALEKYYDTHGEYPSCAQLTQPPETVSSTVLVGLDTDVLKTPKGTANNTLTCGDLTSPSDGDYFAYTGDSSEACTSASGNACVLYILKYVEESSGSIAQINSRRRTTLVDSDIPNLTTSGSGFNTVGASWTSVFGAVSYTIQYSTTTTFPAETAPNSATSGTITAAGSNTSATIPSLSYGTSYYFRAKASSAAGAGGWSTTKTATTWSLSTPSLTTTASGFYSVNASWGAISHAASYTLQYSTTTTFPSESAGNTAASGTLTTNLTSMSVGSLSYNTLYYFRVKATASSYASGWSTTRNATTWSLGNPGVSCGSVTTSSTTCTWAAVANATSYDYQTRVNGGAWAAVINQTGTSVTMSNGTQGTLLEIQVRSKNGSLVSSWVSDGATLTVSTPAWNRWNQTESYPSWTSWIDRTDNGALCGSGMAMYSNFRDGVYGSHWNAWRGVTNMGAGATDTAQYVSTISNYTSTLQVEIQGYCRNETTGAVSSTVSSGVYTAIHSTPPGAVLSGAASCVQAYNVRDMFDVVLTLQETSMDINANSSTVSWWAYRRSRNNAYHTWNLQYQAEDQHNVVVHGTSVKSGPSASYRFYNSYSVWATEALYNTSSANVDSNNSGAINIAHNADGTATIYGSVSDTFGAQVFGAASCGLNYTLSDLR